MRIRFNLGIRNKCQASFSNTGLRLLQERTCLVTEITITRHFQPLSHYTFARNTDRRALGSPLEPHYHLGTDLQSTL